MERETRRQREAGREGERKGGVGVCVKEGAAAATQYGYTKRASMARRSKVT